MNQVIQKDLEEIASQVGDISQLRKKTILISGASGMLPSYLVESLLYFNNIDSTFDVRVIALVRNIERAKKRFIDYQDDEHLKIIEHDVCDPYYDDEKIDFIIHAASQASPKYYGTDPVGTLSANVTGTINLLELARKNNIESFLYFSSSEVYGIVDEKNIPTKEDKYGYVDPMNVRSCYAESKRMGETICISYMHQYNVPVKIVRPFHTYGPGMALDDGRVYADFVASVVNNANIVMNSNGQAKRAFCYLADATVAFFITIINGENGEAYNVGNPDCETSIIEFAQQLIELFPSKKLSLERKEINSNYLKSKVSRNCPDISKLNKLGWFPKTKLNEGLYKTVLSYE